MVVDVVAKDWMVDKIIFVENVNLSLVQAVDKTL